VLGALQQAHIPLAAVGIEVREINADKPFISINHSQPMNPASTMKLLTTYAGLELLGPAYSWKTEAWLNGKLEKGDLYGDLILKGFGDPKLTYEQLWLWLRELRGRGLRNIHGNVLLDHSAFQLAAFDPAAFDKDPLRAYNVGPDALLLNFNAINLHFIPLDKKVSILSEPELAGISLDNAVSVVAQGDCANWDDNIFPQLKGMVLSIQGTFPSACGERTENVSLLPHSQFLNALFRALWKELGGTLSGDIRDDAMPINAALFATHSSPPLAETIRDINKFSNNVMARQLFLSLSLSTNAPASIERSQQIVHDWLAQNKLVFPELVLENGAGLSREERISPRSMALLLQAAQASPFQAEFEASLPILGVDGTMKKRLRESIAATHAHLKSGSLEGVKTLAGYVQSASGKRWIVVFFINHANASSGKRAQDALIEWVQRL
jgi:D-alanyl-D-alanine carboxypeptidase/D-alanyl-D-alanine-endopeptidase (penicillin-binding protein 4)